MKNRWDLATNRVPGKDPDLTKDFVDTQADQSLRWVHIPSFTFCCAPPRRHMTSKQRRIDVDATLFIGCVLAGSANLIC